MLGVKHQALTAEKGLYYYQGQLFTGVCFYLDDQGSITQKSLIEAGQFVGDYRDPYLPNRNHAPEKDLAVLHDEYEDAYDFEHSEFAYYQGEEYSGFGYLFVDDECYYFYRYHESNEVDSVCYYSFNQPQSIHIVGEEILQSYSWDRDGRVTDYAIINYTKHVSLMLHFSTPNQLFSIQVSKTFFERLHEFEDQLYFNLVPTLASLKQFGLSPMLRLKWGGNGSSLGASDATSCRAT